MRNNRILNIQQVLESEDMFIKKNSLKKILRIAGEKIASYIIKNYKKKKILFICGPGNNGNDGIIASEFLKKNKIKSSIFLIANEIKKKWDFKLKNLFKTHDIIVDCIFGIGLNKEVRKNYKKIIKLINQSKKVKVSIDMPSGINGNTGEINSIAVKSNITLVMGFFKPAHFLLPAKILCGEIILLNLGLSIPKKCIPEIRLITLF